MFLIDYPDFYSTVYTSKHTLTNIVTSTLFLRLPYFLSSVCFTIQLLVYKVTYTCIRIYLCTNQIFKIKICTKQDCHLLFLIVLWFIL